MQDIFPDICANAKSGRRAMKHAQQIASTFTHA